MNPRAGIRTRKTSNDVIVSPMISLIPRLSRIFRILASLSPPPPQHERFQAGAPLTRTRGKPGNRIPADCREFQHWFNSVSGYLFVALRHSHGWGGAETTCFIVISANFRPLETRQGPRGPALQGLGTTACGADFRGVSETMLLNYSSETLLKQVHSGSRILGNRFQDAE